MFNGVPWNVNAGKITIVPDVGVIVISLEFNSLDLRNLGFKDGVIHVCLRLSFVNVRPPPSSGIFV
jgi:hypothetical protein